MTPSFLRHPAAPYVASFAVFVILLLIGPQLPIGAWEHPLRVLILSAALLVFSRRVIDLKMDRPMGSVLLGAVVFIIWIAPDVLWAGYRDHWLFQNAITGELTSSLPESQRIDMMALVCRSIRAVVLVPIIEELFWRGWLMRWLIRDDFDTVPLGAYTARAFWITAILFASEHGPYWEVGLLAGVAYNWWIIRSKRLGDCILAHAVTNALLSAYVIAAGKWEYWM
jgi:hypothetical protein